MSTPTLPPIVYPDSDGEPIADNTLQFEWIATIKGNLDILYRDSEEVFVAGDLLWYPVEGEPTIRQAPDAMVAFGRPKGYRGSYRQWEEAGIAPQVVFEVRSPRNYQPEMVRKHRFYERYGVEEYYLYDPDRLSLEAYHRVGSELRQCPEASGLVSPRLGIRFEMTDETLIIYQADGRRFLTVVELDREREAAELQAQAALRQAEAAQREAQAAQREAQAAQREAQAAQREAQDLRQRAARMAERLRALGLDPEA